VLIKSYASHKGLIAAHIPQWRRMDIEQTIAEIEWLERISSLPDTRPLSASDLAARLRCPVLGGYVLNCI
jgi:hypothetical protein